jgi:uncharacterized cupredoxin-like copper-binding protein
VVSNRPNKLRDAVRPLRSTLIVVSAFMAASIIAVVIALAVSSDGRSGTPVGLREYKITMPAQLSTGVHTFALTNSGTMGHELVIFKTCLRANKLPLKADGDVNEESAKLHTVADSGDALKAGGSQTVKSDALSPGHYVALCNLPGHYRRGMKLDVTVR